jgi:hypothetical protein
VPLLVVWWLRGRVPRANAALVGSARECLRIPCERTVLQPPGFGSISPRSRPRFAKPRARDRSEEPLIPFTRQTSSPSDAPLSRPSRCAPMPFIVSHHRAQISPCPEPPAPAASCDATLPPRTALASDPNAFCRFDPRCASRYEPSRHELALVSSGRGPYAESGFAQEPALAAPPIRLFRDWIVDCSLEPVITRSSAVEARSRARSAWDASGGDPGPFDRHMQPTRFIFNDESDRLGSFRIVFPRDSGASGSTPAARFGGPCTAFQQLCAPRHFLRVTPHGVPLTSLVALAASDRDEPRARR